MKQSRRSKPEYQIRTARERIDLLVEKAVKMHASRPELSRRYFQLARRIGMRYNVRLPSQYKRKFCKFCYSYLTGGWRFEKGVARITCKQCGRTMHYPYKLTR